MTRKLRHPDAGGPDHFEPLRSCRNKIDGSGIGPYHNFPHIPPKNKWRQTWKWTPEKGVYLHLRKQGIFVGLSMFVFWTVIGLTYHTTNLQVSPAIPWSMSWWFFQAISTNTWNTPQSLTASLPLKNCKNHGKLVIYILGKPWKTSYILGCLTARPWKMVESGERLFSYCCPVVSNNFFRE